MSKHRTRTSVSVVALSLCCAILSLTSCTTIIDTVIQEKLGYTDAEVEELRQTPDPEIKLNKITAMMVGELTKIDNERDTSTIQDKISAKKLSQQALAIEKQVFAPEPTGKEETVQVPVDGGTIPMVMVWPKDYEKKESFPLIMMVHGGSFSSGKFDTYQRLVSIFADKLDAIVAFPEYRLAPEHKFPIATEDVHAAWQWLVDHASEYKVDTSKLTIAGDSAGGNLAAGLSIRLYENNLPQPSSVVLLYPNLTLMETVYPSRFLFGGIDGKVYIISGPAMERTITNYLGDPSRATEPYASPLIMLQGLVDIPGNKNPLAEYAIDAKPPVKLAPTLLIVAQADPLRDEAILYEASLKMLGTETQMTVYDGVSHGFPMFDRIMPEGHEAMMEATDFIASHW